MGPQARHSVVATLAAMVLVVESCSPVGNPIEPLETNLRANGIVTVDGVPYAGGIVSLAIDDLVPSWYGTNQLYLARTSAEGVYEIAGNIGPAYCGHLWLLIELSPLYRYPLPGCGDFVADIDASINSRVSGTVTLDGSVAGSVDIFLAIDQMDPAGLRLRRLAVTFTDGSGAYGFEHRVAADFCDRLWVWWQSHGVSHAEQVPGCGTHIVDLAATS